MTNFDCVGAELLRAAKGVLVLIWLLLTAGCGSSFERPALADLGPLRDRAITKTEEYIRVSATFPHAD